jgi:hypothetical protein
MVYTSIQEVIGWYASLGQYQNFYNRVSLKSKYCFICAQGIAVPEYWSSCQLFVDYSICYRHLHKASSASPDLYNSAAQAGASRSKIGAILVENRSSYWLSHWHLPSLCTYIAITNNARHSVFHSLSHILLESSGKTLFSGTISLVYLHLVHKL